MAKAKKKLKKKAKKETPMRTRLIRPGEEMPEEDEMDEGESGMFLEKADAQLIYNALREYKPTKKEAHLHSVFVEQFEEMLVVDFGEPFPDAN
jgi:hypothetical protein